MRMGVKLGQKSTCRMKVFADTNILIDFLADREKFYEDAKKIFALGLLNKQQLAISALFDKSTLPVYSPNEFLSLLEKDE